MIEVGKVVTRSELDYRSSSMSTVTNYDHYPRTYTDKNWATVWVGHGGVAITVKADTGAQQLMMTPKQAIEIAQMLMKAAESQAEYAQARKELQDEIDKLDATFKDRISGLGIDGVEESGHIPDERGSGGSFSEACVVRKDVIIVEDVIIVDAG